MRLQDHKSSKWLTQGGKTLAVVFGVIVAVASGGTQVKDDGKLMAEGEAFQNLTIISEKMEGCHSPVLSSEGALLFVSNKHGNPELYLKRNPTGMAVQRLTQHRATDMTPAFSTDGKKMVFSSNRGGSYDIFIASAGGGTAVQQVTDTSEDELWPTWSPDGNKIAYTRYSKIDGQFYIWIKELDTNANIQVAPGRQPEFSPDGQKILYERVSSGTKWYSLWTMNLDGTAPTQITPDSDWGAVSGTWSPDGQRIAFTTSKGMSAEVVEVDDEDGGVSEEVILGQEDANIWVIQADGSKLTQLTTHSRDDYLPFWSADNHIYFVSNRDGEQRLWRFKPIFPDGYDPTAPTAK
jgi:Tol biopolymer transport system component